MKRAGVHVTPVQTCPGWEVDLQATAILLLTDSAGAGWVPAGHWTIVTLGQAVPL